MKIKTKQAFTLVELLVVIAIIGILIGMLLPAVQQVREAARRTACSNKLKNSTLAAHNYQSSFQEFPAGNFHRPGNFWGHSFWVALLPQMEQNNLYDGYDFASGGFTGSSGSLLREWLRDVPMDFLRCPSSSLPEFPVNYSGVPADEYAGTNNSSSNITGYLPCYTGISGSSDHRTAFSQRGGIASMGGVMLGQGPNGDQPTRFAAIRDGASNTLLFGEQSDWMRNDNDVPVDCRADGNHGFNMGGGINATNRWFNLITIRHPINEKIISRAEGAAGNVGPNRPIQSAHPGGAMVSLCDGSVQFLSDSTALQVLFDLADRDDGNIVSIDN
jgi:prepilin-type N-terminal cleavage/methylation domain-containing protein/prepilin-type processing-associated H-X9-DG protein